MGKQIVQFNPANFGSGASAILIGFEVSDPSDLAAHYTVLATKAYPDILVSVGGDAATAVDVWNDYQALSAKLQNVAQGLGVTLPQVAAPEGPPALNG